MDGPSIAPRRNIPVHATIMALPTAARSPNLFRKAYAPVPARDPHATTRECPDEGVNRKCGLKPAVRIKGRSPHVTLKGIFRVPYCKENSWIPESAFAAHFHWVFHWVIPESQLSGVLGRR